MATKKYIGSRYVPLFADPIEWDKKKTYEALTIVYHQGNSYTSRQFVPAGVDITDPTYWALTGNYNAQVEQYRKETASKLSTVTTDATLIGGGTKTEPLKIRLNHSTVMSDTGKTVYPTLMHEQGNAATILGIGFNVGDGLASYNTEDADVGSGVRVESHIIDTVQKVEQRFSSEPTELIVIGDSYGEGIGASSKDKAYAHILSKELGLTLHNYSVGGTGFNNAGGKGKRFDAQIQDAVNDTSFDHAKVGVIVVEGGTNDWGDRNVAKTVTATICDKIQANFPNAHTIFVLTQGIGPGSINLFPAQKILNYPTIQHTAGKYPNTSTLRGDFWFTRWNKDMSSEDYIHPNDIGHNFIAQKIYNALKYGDYNITEMVPTYDANFATVPTDVEQYVSNKKEISYFLGNGLIKTNIALTYTVQAEDIDASHTFYKIDKVLLNFPDNMIINYPNVSPVSMFVELKQKGFVIKPANLFGINKPLAFGKITLSGLTDCRAGDTINFSLDWIIPYYGYCNN